jgi:hypothetical protein
MSSLVTAKDIAKYQRGVVCLRGAPSSDCLSLLAASLEAIQ